MDLKRKHASEQARTYARTEAQHLIIYERTCPTSLIWLFLLYSFAPVITYQISRRSHGVCWRIWWFWPWLCRPSSTWRLSLESLLSWPNIFKISSPFPPRRPIYSWVSASFSYVYQKYIAFWLVAPSLGRDEQLSAIYWPRFLSDLVPIILSL